MIATFDYPGCGFAHAPDIGMAYQAWAGFDRCVIKGTILDSEGGPVGYASKGLTMSTDGTSQITETWIGVEVTAAVTEASASYGKILGVDKVKTTTNESGYFEFDKLVKGLQFTVSCPSFGKTVEVNTTGLDTIDLSTHF